MTRNLGIHIQVRSCASAKGASPLFIVIRRDRRLILDVRMVPKAEVTRPIRSLRELNSVGFTAALQGGSRGFAAEVRGGQRLMDRSEHIGKIELVA